MSGILSIYKAKVDMNGGEKDKITRAKLMRQEEPRWHQSVILATEFNLLKPQRTRSSSVWWGSVRKDKQQ